MSDPLVSIVVPVFNRCDDIRELLESLQRSTYKNFTVILVDNASTDNLEDAARAFPSVRTVRLDKNYGAARARNVGLQHSTGEYVLFLDSDNVVDPHALEELVRAFSDPSVGFAGPKMRYFAEPNRIWYAGAEINLWGAKTTYRGLHRLDEGQYDASCNTGHVPNCWLVRRSLAMASGGLDEDYVMTFAESDWAERVKALGYSIRYVPKAVVFHKIPPPSNSRNALRNIGFESPRRAYYFGRNRFIYVARHGRLMHKAALVALFTPLYVVYYCGHSVAFRRPDLGQAFLKGVADGLRYLMTGILLNRGYELRHGVPNP